MNIWDEMYKEVLEHIKNGDDIGNLDLDEFGMFKDRLSENLLGKTPPINGLASGIIGTVVTAGIIIGTKAIFKIIKK